MKYDNSLEGNNSLLPSDDTLRISGTPLNITLYILGDDYLIKMLKGHGRSESVSALSSQRTDVSVLLTVFSRRCLVERTPDIRHCRKFLVILTSFTHVYVTEARRRVLWTFRVYLSNRSVRPPVQLRNGLKCRVSVHLWQIETCARTFISGTRMFMYLSPIGMCVRSFIYVTDGSVACLWPIGTSVRPFISLKDGSFPFSWPLVASVRSFISGTDGSLALHWRHWCKFREFLTSQCICPRSRMRK